ncbi:GIY-YIG nuclease family protein [Spirosoma agri]|uniref:GIY-YIG nuclease family protein n=1 Tax=Spirosoma agri TaxID=1987381 RepID=A0A6M0IHX1_9BACT|nr:GIY-YIG nuclease family protein [Spirosoma agri]NEU67784.1 GIY-YIG nuclease family protein [Spirosoma agri]
MGLKPTNSLFSQEQELTIIQAYINGKTLVNLAKQYSCSKTTIHRILDGAGVVRRKQNKSAIPKVQTWTCVIDPTPLPECRFPGIYKFTNRINGKIYIGQSRNIHLRYKEHRKDNVNSHSTGLSPALKKYSIDSFNFEVLERVDNLAKLNEREQYWLDFYQSYNKAKGYNRAKVATNFALGCKHSTEANDAKGDRQRAYYALNPSKNIGRKASEETRKKIAEARKRNPFTKEQLNQISAIRVVKMTKRVAQINIETSQVIRVWESVTAIQQSLDIPASCIRYTCRGFSSNKYGRYEKTTHAGYRWEYTELESGIYDKSHIVRVKNVRGKGIAQIDLNTGEVVRMWDNAPQVTKELGLNAESIKNACRGFYVNKSGRHHKVLHAGFKWEYVS